MILDLTKEFIEERSTSYHELSLVERIAKLLDAKGIPAKVDRFNPRDYSPSAPDTETANLYVDIGEGSETLFLYAHTDVVEAPDSLFTPTIEHGKLKGRGTADMKTALAGLVTTLIRDYEQLKHTGKRIIFGFIADEETSASGIKRFVDVYKPEELELRCVLMEPTNDFNQIDVGGRGYTFLNLRGSMKETIASFRRILEHKQELLAQYPDLNDGFGPATLEITKVAWDWGQPLSTTTIVEGKACHASTPHEGENALEKAILLYPNTTYIVTSDTEGPNSLPSSARLLTHPTKLSEHLCDANIDIRTNLAASQNDALLQAMRKLLSPGVTYQIRDKGCAFKTKDRAFIDACKNATDQEVREVIAQGGSDAPYLLELTDKLIPGFGPGNLAVCHTDNEFVSLNALYQTPEVVRRIIRNFEAI